MMTIITGPQSILNHSYNLIFIFAEPIPAIFLGVLYLKMRNNKEGDSAFPKLSFSTFNYFGLGAVLPAIVEAFWIK